MTETTDSTPLQRACAGYPKGDARRALAVLAVLTQRGEASVAELAALTGYNRPSILPYLTQLQTSYGVRIQKLGSRYRLDAIGPLLNEDGLASLLEPDD